MPNRRLISTRTVSSPNGAPEGSGYVWRGQDKATPTTSSRRDGEKQALGEAIRTARKVRDLRQSGVAAAAGISGAHLSNIENGHDRPSPEVLSRLAAALGVTSEDLTKPGTGDPAGAVEAPPFPRRAGATRPSPSLPSGSAAGTGPTATQAKGRS
jgi:DNA-binding XRE family transcriptional regulator